jgi:uncharacterized protein YkwD
MKLKNKTSRPAMILLGGSSKAFSTGRTISIFGIIAASLFFASCQSESLSTSPPPSRSPAVGGDSSNPAKDKSVNDKPASPPAPPSPVVVPPQKSDCYKADPFICKIESLITAKTNKYRATRGLGALVLDPKLGFVARDWSVKQGRSGSMGHSGFPTSREAVYRAEFGVSRGLRAENVAYTGGMFDSAARDDAAAEAVAEEFAVMWWNSAGHRANMLGRYSNLGVGISESNSEWYATQLFD